MKIICMKHIVMWVCKCHACKSSHKTRWMRAASSSSLKKWADLEDMNPTFNMDNVFIDCDQVNSAPLSPFNIPCSVKFKRSFNWWVSKKNKSHWLKVLGLVCYQCLRILIFCFLSSPSSERLADQSVSYSPNLCRVHLR